MDKPSAATIELKTNDAIRDMIEDGSRFRELHRILFNHFREKGLILLTQNALYGVVDEESGETLFEHESYTASIKFALKRG